MARVDVIREVRSGGIGKWQLCFDWARYRMDDGGVQYGDRFVWRRPNDGSIQAARGQARIGSIREGRDLMKAAEDAGWRERDWALMEAAKERLEDAGCVVDPASGYTGWPTQHAAESGNLSAQMADDARFLRESAH